jgi:hypothetical protein
MLSGLHSRVRADLDVVALGTTSYTRRLGCQHAERTPSAPLAIAPSPLSDIHSSS